MRDCAHSLGAHGATQACAWLLLLLLVSLPTRSSADIDTTSKPHVPQSFDVLALAVHPSCVAPLAVHGLNQHFPIRKVHIITSTEAKCGSFKRFAANVECYVEDRVIPGLNISTVETHLKLKFAADTHSQQIASQRAGWYLQQLLKLGAAVALRDLTDYFMIWDLDMIPMSPFPALLPPADDGGPIRTRADISAVRIREYELSYRTLFQRPPEYPRPGMSFVAHWAMIHKPAMLQLLNHLTSGLDTFSWMWRILDSVHPGARNVYYGFSEYTTYISWMLQHEPQTVDVAPSKAWIRVAPKRHDFVRALNYSKCCPDARLLDEVRRQGWLYFGWELGRGHAPECASHLSV